MANYEIEPLIRVENITKNFSNYNNYKFCLNIFSAISDVSFNIYKGQTLGLVGASGSGKSTLGRILMRLIKPSFGNVFYKDQDLFLISNKDLKKIRTDLQIVFQNPYLSLNNLMTVETILLETLSCFKFKNINKLEKKERISELIDLVGLDQKIKYKYPSELSGGECQRVAIARSLAVEPKFIIFDEATSALDVIVQDKIINIIKKIQKKMDLTYLFISHNIGLVKEISDNIAVMNMGKIVEIGESKKIYDFPKKDYTKQLISSFKNLSKN
ncbi:MAG: ABC transporter ATP-binding protein [Oscillospiraceae bacterium]|nr:ABC transporter ATP-binding protein [Oscillospiraceae bacterium]